MEEQIQQLLQAATDFLNSNIANGTWIKTLLYSPLFTTFAGAAVALLAPYLATNLQGRQRRNEQLRKKYEEQLNEFYNPLIFLLERTTAVYKLFNLEEKKKNEDVKTLELLLDGHTFSPDDLILLDEIIEYNKKIATLISSYGRHISPDILSSLIELVNHYELIERARQGKLENIPEYRACTYPRDILDVLKKKQRDIYEKLDKLQ